MELRYVYRRVEDAIGTPLNIKDSPHAELTRQLRYAVKEHNAFSHRTEMLALCLASMAGNSSINVSSISERVSELLDTAFTQSLPYFKDAIHKEAQTPRKSSIDEAFEQLAKFTEELKARQQSKYDNLDKKGDNK